MSDPPREILVRRASGTHGDVLAAVGLADLLSPPDGPQAWINETPEGFVVRPGEPLTEDFLGRLSCSVGYSFLKPKEDTDAPAGAEGVVSYKREAARVKQYWQLRRQAQASRESASDLVLKAQIDELAPSPDWRLYQVLNVLKGHDATNKTHAKLVEMSRDDRRCLVAQGIDSLAGGARFEPWRAKFVQLFTPTGAKGYARLRPDGTPRGDPSKDRWAEPLGEWLKYRGYFVAACPCFLGPKGEHIHLVCPVPARIGVHSLRAISAQLRERPMGGSAPKVDILAVLNLVRMLIRHSEYYARGDVERLLGIEIGGCSPADVVSGVTIAHYQSMGSARAISSLSTLALPNWFKIVGNSTAVKWLEIIDEHVTTIRRLKDDRSDEIGLMIQYRRFLERRGAAALEAFLDFAGAYGQFVIRTRDQKRAVWQLTATKLEEVVMALDAGLSVILEDPGFKAVATAVRKSTVSAQAQKAMKKPDYREIRYDLIPELRRKRSLPGGGDFVEAISQFVSSYNYENARRREMGKPAPRNVTTEEFESFCSLMDSRKPALVGALLCAYGTCKAGRAEVAPESDASADDVDQSVEDDSEEESDE